MAKLFPIRLESNRVRKDSYRSEGYLHRVEHSDDFSILRIRHILSKVGGRCYKVRIKETENENWTARS